MDSSEALTPDLRAALEGFDREADAIIASFVKPLKAKEPPPVIYHYTNDLGLRGILETGKIWLTNIFNLNDPSELSHGFSLAVKILNNKAASGQTWSKELAEQLEAFVQRRGIQRVGHYFVCSFSSCRDDLGQWRAYADNGRGYALGFDTNALEAAFTNLAELRSAHLTFRVTYDDAQLEEMHRRIVEKMFEVITLSAENNLPFTTIQDYLVELSTSFAARLLRAALYFKHKAYDNEEEYRFLQLYSHEEPVPDLRLRARPYSLVKYREFDWRSVAPRALKEIVVGPAADYEKVSTFARECLGSFHNGNVGIDGSKIPYRAV